MPLEGGNRAGKAELTIAGNKGHWRLGIDQPRQQALLEAAYNDEAGVSDAFAKNLLLRLKRDINVEIDPDQFSYQAHWEPEQQRIKMSLVAKSSQCWNIDGSRIAFRAGEALITEYSYKYGPTEFLALATSAGWEPYQRWCDAEEHFSLHLLTQGDDACKDA